MVQPQPPVSLPPGGVVVLKKYGNRRLYDTHASRYVTLEEVELMVQRGTDIQVVDAKTHEDLTKEILVQIILDKDVAKEMLPTGFLKQVVRLSSSPLKESFTRALQDSLDGFLTTQRSLFDAQRQMVGQLAQMAPMAAMTPFNPWNPFAAPGPQVAAGQAVPPLPTAKDAELERMRAEMGQMHSMLQQLIEREGESSKPKKRPTKR